MRAGGTQNPTTAAGLRAYPISCGEQPGKGVLGLRHTLPPPTGCRWGGGALERTDTCLSSCGAQPAGEGLVL